MFKFGDAARSAGMTQGQLRNWLARHGDLWLSSEREPGKWREFTFMDCIALAMMNHLIRCGASIIEANEIAFVILSGRKAEMEPAMPAPRLSGGCEVFVLRGRRGDWQAFDQRGKARSFAAYEGAAIILEIFPVRIADQVAAELKLGAK